MAWRLTAERRMNTMRTVRSVVDPAVFIHPAAICESHEIGEGTRVWAFAHVMAGAIVGRHCNVCDHAFIEGGARLGDRVTVKNNAMIWEGVTVEDDVFIGPGVILTNDRYPRSPRMFEVAARYGRKENWLTPAHIRRGASIGAGAIIVCGITVGRFAGVGAGAVVTADVPDHRLVYGNPARPAGWLCTCGRPLDDSLTCTGCTCHYSLCGDTLSQGE